MTRHHQADRSWKSGRSQQGQRDSQGSRGQGRQGSVESHYGEPSYSDVYNRNDESFYMGGDDYDPRSTFEFGPRPGLEGSGGWDSSRSSQDRFSNERFAGDRGQRDFGGDRGQRDFGGERGQRDFGGDRGQRDFGGDRGQWDFGGERGQRDFGSERYANERFSPGYGDRGGLDRFGNDQRYSYNDRFDGVDRFSQNDGRSMHSDVNSSRPRSNESNHNFNGTYTRPQHNASSTQNQDSFAGRGPKGFKRSDERLHEEICERLTHHPGIDASDVEVKVQAGVVTLSGEVSERRAKRMIAEEVEDIWGVTDVTNELKVKAPASASGKATEDHSSASTMNTTQNQTAQKTPASRSQPAQ